MKVLSFRAKLVLAFSISLGLALAMFMLVSSYWHLKYLEESVKARLRAVAVSAAALVDVQAHEELRSKDDMADPRYGTMIRRLNAILRGEPSLKYIYTLRPVVNTTPTGKKKRGYQFVLDGGSAGTALDPSNPEFSKIGDAYEKLPPAARKVFKTLAPQVDLEPVEDKWGVTLSGYAPLIDAKGRVVGLLGVDMTLEELQGSISVVYVIAATGFLAAVLLGWLMAYLVSNMVMEPIDQLYHATKRIVDGDLKTPIVYSRRDDFSQVLGTFNRMMISIEKAQDLAAQRAHDKAQLEMAATVQDQLFRWPAQKSDKVKVHYFARTAETTGGDWAHFHLSQGRYLYMLCADVVGHGVASAMVAAAVAGCFETLKGEIDAAPRPLEPLSIMDHMQRVVTAASRGQFPMTAFILVADLDTGELQYSGAAHPAARIVRRVPDEGGGPPRKVVTSLTMRADYLGDPVLQNYTQRSARIQPGDLLVLFTDGLIERRNEAGETYGTRRLDRILRRAVGGPEQLITHITSDVHGFVGHEAIEDDVSIMVASILEGACSQAPLTRAC